MVNQFDKPKLTDRTLEVRGHQIKEEFRELVDGRTRLSWQKIDSSVKFESTFDPSEESGEDRARMEVMRQFMRYYR